MASHWYVYIIRFDRNKLYTGVTTDVARRFEEHSKGGAKAAKALKGKGPYTLVYSEQAGSRSEAQAREYQIKQWSREKKQALITGYKAAT